MQMVKLMYIDDDEDDRDLVKQTLIKRRPDVDLFLAENGLEGYKHLKKLANEGEELPCLVILDLNMPGWNGKETFAKMRAEKELSDIPVAVLTSSGSPQDQDFFHSKELVSFFTKPSDLDRMNEILDEILQNC